MAGKFTGLRYDDQAYNEHISRSTDPLKYRLDPNYAVNCNKCFAPHATGAQPTADAAGQKIDVDSILRGIGKPHSKSNVQQLPQKLTNYNTVPLNDCPAPMESEYTRFTHPSFDIRGLNVPDMRLGYPLHDPQCQIFEDFSVNTRLQSKDNHKTIWQAPFSQRESLPTERLGRVKKCKITLNCDYAPYESGKN